jgi:hypothetical protein
MSLRNMSVRDGNGPMVSLGVTAQPLLPVVVPVPGVSFSDGLVAESPHAAAIADAAAPSAPKTARRLSCPPVPIRRPAHADAVEARQHHIEQNQVKGCRTRHVEGLAAIPGFVEGEPPELEMQAKQLANGRIVFDDQRSPRKCRRHAA